MRADTKGAEAVAAKYRGNGSKPAPPYFTVLDAQGKVLATHAAAAFKKTGNAKVLITSDDPDRGNIGYPGWAGSEPHFRSMLQAAAKHMTPAEIDALIKSVKAFTTARLTT